MLLTMLEATLGVLAVIVGVAVAATQVLQAVRKFREERRSRE